MMRKKAAALYLETLYGAQSWEAMGEKQEAVIAKLLVGNDWIEIDPSEYIVNSLNWSNNKEDSSRSEGCDSQSPYYGKFFVKFFRSLIIAFDLRQIYQ